MSLASAGMDFSGKLVWVTGAAQGIGARIADDIRQLGGRVLELDQHYQAFELSELMAGGNCGRVELDLADPQAVQQVVESLLECRLGPDVLINAAGVLRNGNVDQLSLADWKLCFDVNVNGVFYLLQALMPWFKADVELNRQRNRNIVTLASNAAHVPRLGMAAYCASKSAVVSLCQCVGLELAGWNLRCNLVSPGSTDTPMLRAMVAQNPEDAEQVAAGYQQLVQGLPQQYKLAIPLQKVARDEEISASVLFLASPLASHITMHDLVVDGGATLSA
ncbi:2,3-dihydro-2,3-dihydroxybenzoate dehydrogenase [Oceanobacter mangrovi]|uniref:2,3-dihydro-2,3-dihydroxybenzoate dehydrogenase n=1 Tax=Oceanobacter mangrovi TaxID=2862510 RepID=UPI002484908C|nr:2,3-dihydro-2,3-dihydroxybenzoate dehydrogenase [Oceanobacter mangrovi]